VTWHDRILDDGTDRDRWLAAREPVIGASDAAKLAKASSVESVLKAKLAPRTFHGNEYTESGHRWEPIMLGWAGIPGNVALIHSPAEPGFAATPDGIELNGSRLAECKAKHNKIVDGPTPMEWRQMAFQLYTVPEADVIEFIWAEIVNGEMRTLEPKHLTIERCHPKIQAATALILPLATDLLARLRAARQFEMELLAS
jgi:hypothetical protein